MVLEILSLLVVYAIVPIVISGALARAFRYSGERAMEAAVLSFGFGPMAAGWLLEWMFRIAPHQTAASYVAVLSAVILVLALYGRGKIAALGPSLPLLWRAFAARDAGVPRTVHIGLVALVLCVIGFLLLQGLVDPLVENDPLKHANVARMVVRDMSVEHYPYAVADPITGYYAAAVHPMGFHMIQVWLRLLSGSAGEVWTIKTVTPFYLLCLSAAIFVAMRKFGTLTAWLAVAIFLAAPLIANVARINHIDIFRLYFFFAAFAFLARYLQDRLAGDLAHSAIGAGMALYAHAAGILFVPLAIGVFAVAFAIPLKQRIIAVCVILAVAGLIGGRQYVVNYQLYGSPVTSKELVWDEGYVQGSLHTEYTRNIITPYDKVVHGALRGFTQLNRFGFTYWLFVLTLIIGWRKILADRTAATFTLVIGGFGAGVLLSMLLGLDIIIKNPRYFLTIHPLMSAVAAIGLAAVVRLVMASPRGEPAEAAT